MTFSRKHVGQELSKQKQNDSKVDHPNSNLLACKLKASEVGRDEINQQHTAHQVAGRKDGDFPGCSRWSPINEEAAKEFVLGFQKSHLDLGDSSEKDENQPQAEAKDSEPEGGEKFDQPVEQAIERTGPGGGAWSVMRAA